MVESKKWEQIDEINYVNDSMIELNYRVIDSRSNYSRTLRYAKTVDEIMVGKQLLLVNLVETIPTENMHNDKQYSREIDTEISSIKQKFIKIIKEKYYTKEERKAEERCVDENIITSLLYDMERISFQHGNIFSRYTQEILNAESLSDITQAKRGYLFDRMRYIPMGGSSCYYCIEMNDSDVEYGCQHCHYAAIHGICEHSDSDYSQISEVRKEFRLIIKNNYNDYFEAVPYI